MYLYYEKYISPDGDTSKDVYEMVLSSNGRNNILNTKIQPDKAYIGIILPLFKLVDLKNRDYDENLHVWTFIGHHGSVIIASFESMITQGLLAQLQIKCIDNLKQKAECGELNKVHKTIPADSYKYDEKDFFYTPPTSQEAQLSGAALIQKLSELMSCSSRELEEAKDQDLKKLYRRAAMLLHPDRNGGDSSKMSELNMLWRIYTAKGA